MTYSTYEDLQKIYKDSVSDIFDDNLGQWNNYTTYNQNQADQLSVQKHTDIRSFYNTSFSSVSVFDLYNYSVGSTGTYHLGGRTLAAIESLLTVANEAWEVTAPLTPTAATVSNTTVYNGYYGINFSCKNGTPTNDVQSVLTSNPIDISNYSGSDYIIATFPDYPSSNITASTSYLDISSDATGNFAADKTVSVPFNGNLTQIGSTGVYELKCLISALTLPTPTNNWDNKSITAIRFRIKVPTTNCNFKCISIKCVDQYWKSTPVDIDTINNRVIKTVPNSVTAFPDSVYSGVTATSSTSIYTYTTTAPHTLRAGSTVKITGFTTSDYNGIFQIIDVGSTTFTVSNPTAPTPATTPAVGTGTVNVIDWTLFVRSFGKLFNLNDPKIVNGSMAANIEIGSIANTTTNTTPTIFNSFAFYFDLGTKNASQLTLNDKKQSFLETSGVQPDALADTYTQVHQGDLSIIPTADLIDPTHNQVQPSNTYSNRPGKTQSDLNLKTQEELNRVLSLNTLDYLKIEFDWYKNNSTWTGSVVTVNESSNVTVTATTTGKPVIGMSITGTNIPSSTTITDINGPRLTLSNATTGAGTSTNGSAALPDDYVGKITVSNSGHNIYQFTIPSSINLKNSRIIFNPVLEDDYIQIYIYKYDKYVKPQLVYKTEKIFNSTSFLRSRGRVGWSANFADADSYINAINSRGLVYGEYKANAMESRTPLKGVQLFSDYSKDIELLTSNVAYDTSTKISNDYDKTTGTVNTKIDVNANAKLGGIVTNLFHIEDPEDLRINLNIWSATNKVRFVLLDSNNLLKTDLQSDYYSLGKWSNINIRFKRNDFVAGDYKLAIICPYNSEPVTWWINSFSIKKRLVSWEARSNGTKMLNYDFENWIDFKNTVNYANDGVLFNNNKGKSLQFRARAKSHYATIDTVKTVPVYSTLGNFVWRDDQ